MTIMTRLVGIGKENPGRTAYHPEPRQAGSTARIAAERKASAGRKQMDIARKLRYPLPRGWACHL